MSTLETNLFLSQVPNGPDGPVFAEPWEAQAFAITVHLNERGLFEWAEWARYLSAELAGEDAANDGSDYYRHWLAALEKLLISKGVAEADLADGLATIGQSISTQS